MTKRTQKPNKKEQKEAHFHDFLARIHGSVVVDVLGAAVGGMLIGRILHVRYLYSIPAVFLATLYVNRVLGIRRWRK